MFVRCTPTILPMIRFAQPLNRSCGKCFYCSNKHFIVAPTMKKLLVFTLAALALSLTTLGFKTTGYSAGDEARDFSLKNVDGKMVSLSGYSNAKGCIVTFTCNHCPFAK